MFEVFVYKESVIGTIEWNKYVFFFEDFQNLRLKELERIGIELTRFQTLEKDIERDVLEFCEIESFFRLSGVKEWKYIVIKKSEIYPGQNQRILFFSFGNDCLKIFCGKRSTLYIDSESFEMTSNLCCERFHIRSLFRKNKVQ